MRTGFFECIDNSFERGALIAGSISVSDSPESLELLADQAPQRDSRRAVRICGGYIAHSLRSSKP